MTGIDTPLDRVKELSQTDMKGTIGNMRVGMLEVLNERRMLRKGLRRKMLR